VASQTDGFGNTGSAALTFTLDSTAPSVAITSTGGPTNQANQTITGTVDVADAGASVTILDGATPIGTAIVQGNGNWSSNVTLNSGSNALTAQVSDAAGNTATSTPVVFTLATIAPTIAITTPVAGDNVINKSEAATGVIISGTATAGSAAVNGQTAIITILDSTNAVKDTYTTTVTNGTWSVTVTAAQAQALAEGSYSIKANVSDAAGNAAPTATQAIAIERVAPTVTIGTAGTATNQTTQTISGTVTAATGEASVGSTVTLFDSVNGGAATQIGTATVGTGGAWSTSVTLSGNGSHSIAAKDTDAAGNLGTSTAVVFTLTVVPGGWGNPSGGNWNDAANWSSGSAPTATSNVVFNSIGATTPYVVTIPSSTLAVANSITLNDPNITLLDEGTLAIAASLIEISGTLEIENGGSLSLGGGPSFMVDFAGTGGSLGLGSSSGFTGTINAISTATGPVTISGGGAITTTIGDAIDVQASGGTLTSPASLGIALTGAVTGAATGISVIQNGYGPIVISTSGAVVGLAGDGVLAEDLNSADNSNITVIASGNVSGTNYGIGALTDGSGSVSVAANPNVSITGQARGIWAGSNGTGNISVTTSSGDVITSESVGISAFNQATSIPLADASTIIVTANGTINSGPRLNPDGTQPAGILAGYKGGANSTPNANVFGNVTVSNFANITASGGDGIRGYNYGTGDITITDEANTTIAAPGEFGIRATNYGSGSVSITTSSGDLITSGESGISAVNLATAIASAAGSSINVVAHGIINSGTNLNPSGSQTQGISAGYFGANGTPNNAINGTVSVDNFANVTAAAGWGLNAFNWGNGLVTVTEEAGTSVTGAEYGIGAYSLGTGSGGVTVNVLSGTTITAGALYGLAGIQASSNNASNISVTTANGDIITSGGMGINVNSAATSAPSSSQISITVNGSINSGFDSVGGSPGGIWAGYSNGSTVNTAVAGNVSVDNFATIQAAAGAGIGLYNLGVGNVSLTLESSSAITAPSMGVRAFAQGGGNVTIRNSGTIASAIGSGILAGTGTLAANSVSGLVSVTNSGTIASLGSSFNSVIQINNSSTKAASFTNTGSVTANLYAASNFNFAIAEFNGAINISNSGTISGNVSLGPSSTFNNQPNGIWNIRGQNFFNVGVNTITNFGTINMAGVSALNAAATLAVTNFGAINIAAIGAAYIGGAVSGTGTLNIGDRAELEFASTVSAGQTVSFGGNKGVLILDNPSGFIGSISGLAVGDIIALQGPAITSASVSGSTLTVTQSGVLTPLSYTISGTLIQDTFSVLSGNTIVLVPTTATVLTGSLVAQSFAPTTAQFYQLTGATISSSAAIGLNIAASDTISADTIFAEINQPSSIAVTGTFNGMNLTTTGANVVVISAGSISSSGGVGLFTSSATGSTTIVDYGNVSGTIGIEALTTGAAPLSIIVNGAPTLTATGSRGIFALTSAGSANVTTGPSVTISAAGSGIVVENQGTSVPLSSLTVEAAGTIKSGQVSGSEPAAILVGYMGGTSSPSSIPNPPLTGIFGNVTIDSSATITAFTGIGINAFNYGTGDISVSNAGTITATNAGTTTTTTAQYGIGAFNYGTGDTTVVLAAGATINSGSTGILASNQATVIGAATPTTVSVTSLGTITSGTNLNNGGSAPAGIIANINPGGTGTYNGNVNGNVFVTAGSVTANAGNGIRAMNDGIGNVTVNLVANAIISALNSATATSGSNAPYGVNAVDLGAGDVAVTTSDGDVINSTSSGINANNQATAITSAGNALVTVNAAGSINSGNVQTNNGSAPASIGAGFLGGTAVAANLNVNGNVIVNSTANISAAAGWGINAFNYGNGDVTVNNTGNVTVTGSSVRANSTTTTTTEAAEYGIEASADSGGAGDVAINVYSGNISATSSSTTITNPIYGVFAFSNASGNISVLAANSSSIITSSGVGINAVNEAATIAPSLHSSIVVTSYAIINSGAVVTGTESPPGGIIAGYLGGSTIPTNFPLTGLYGDVVVNNFGNINASAGDGIRAYNYGYGDVTVNENASITASQNWTSPVSGFGAGINASNEGPGNINVTTATGTVIKSGGSGISALNRAPAPATTAEAGADWSGTSEVTVVARGTINSGTIPTLSGDPAAGILAGFDPNAANTVNSTFKGDVLIDDYAIITAAAGTDGIRGINYVNGSVTVIAEASAATISGGRYGIGAFSYGSVGPNSGNVSITNYATVTGSTAAIDAQASGSGTITIDNFGSITGAIVAATAATTFHNEAGATWTASGNGSFAGTSQLINDGSITLSAGTNLTVAGTLAGGGQINIGSGADLILQGQIAPTTTETITFQGSGTLTLSSAELNNSLNFTPVISGLDPTDMIDYQGAVTSAFWNSGILTLMNGTTAVAYLHLSGNYASATFTVTQVGGVSQIVDPVGAVDTISNGAVLELSAPTSDKVSFTGSTGSLVLDQPASFEGQIAGLSGPGDVLTLKGFDATYTTADAIYNPQNDTTLLTVTDTLDHHSVSLILDGYYSSTKFDVTAHQNGGVDIASGPASVAIVSDGETLELNHASSEHIAFDGGAGSLILDQPTTFAGHISGFRGTAPDAAHSDTIDLVGIDHASSGFSETFNTSTGQLMVTDGSHYATFNFDNFSGALHFASDHHGGTLITDPPVRLIAQQSPGAANASSDQFDFKPALGNAGRIDNFKSNHSEFDLDHFTVNSNDTNNLTEWFWGSATNSKKELPIDPGLCDHRVGHDPILSSNNPLGSPHMNDYVLPSH
jgi:hypothetical protein